MTFNETSDVGLLQTFHKVAGFNFCDFLQPWKTWNLRPGKLSTNKVCFYWLFYFSDYDCETVCRIVAVLGSTAPLLPSDAVSTLIGRFIIS